MNQLFNDLDILDQTKDALKELGLTEPTEIQKQAIPKMILGSDLIAQAKTGTGKTFAFAIPIIEKLDIGNKSIQSLVLTPTRELAIQVYKEIIKLLKFNNKINVSLIVGGESYTRQFKSLKQNPHIIVATPGRLIDHIERKTIDLTNLKNITLDEADEMLKMGFQEDIVKILKDTPNTRQTVLFSATIPPFIKKLAKDYLKNPETIKVSGDSLTVDRIKQNYFLVKQKDKNELLVRLIDYLDPKSAIIFTNTKKEVDEINEYLIKSGYSSDALHGDLKQNQRTYVMNNFRKGNKNLLIATDVAARGLDVSDLELVINYDVPHELELYVHRIGRTARAGSLGLAYSFITPRKKNFIKEIEKFANTKLKFEEIPTAKDIIKKQNESFINELKGHILNNETDNSDIINTLFDEGFSKDEIINALIENIKPKTNDYKALEIINHKENKTKRHTKNLKESFINLGHKDKLTPDTLLKLLRREYGIDPRFVGNIKHYQTETKFELSERDLKKLKGNKKVIFKGKRIKFRS